MDVKNLARLSPEVQGGPRIGSAANFDQAVKSAPANRIATLLPVAAILVPLSMVFFIGWMQWNTVWLDARTDMDRAAQSAAEYGKRSLESYASLAGWVNERVRGMSDEAIRNDEQSLHLDLQKINDNLDQAEVAFVIDRNGFPLVSNTLFPVARETSLSDRDYFQALKGDDTIDTYVSKTFIGRFDKKLYFSVAQHRTDTGQTASTDDFQGVVLVSVNPNSLADGMRRLLNEPTDRMALVRADGHGLSTTGGTVDMTNPLPKVDVSSPFYGFADRLATSGEYVSTTATPGSSSLLAMRLVDGFPIYAISIRSTSDIVLAWWRSMATFFVFGMFATTGLFLLSLKVVKSQRTLAAKNLLLRKDNILSSDRLDRAKTFGLVGTFEFDIVTGVSRRSPEYMAVHNLPAIAKEETHDDWARRLHPDDRDRAEAEVRRVLADNSDETEYAQTYRVISTTGETRWIAARGTITRDASGRATELLGAHVDVTPLRNTELALAESDARLRMAQDALGIGTWEWIADKRSVRCSQTMAAMWGFDPQRATVHLKEVLSRVHPDDRAYFRERIDAVAETGSFKSEFRIEFSTPQGKKTTWVLVRGTLLKSSDASRARLTGIAYDITERKQADELLSITAHEVEHRAKNTLALVSGLMRMTKADSAGQLVQVMEGRIKALSSTMGLLSKNKWSGTSIRDIVESGLGPFVSDHDFGENSSVSLAGPDIIVDADSAQPLAMAIHELATNASKYGSLSATDGKLSVTWESDGSVVRLMWRESGGPKLDGPPQRVGFGSKLVSLLFEGQLRGRIIREWNADGLTCYLTFSPQSKPPTGAKTI